MLRRLSLLLLLAAGVPALGQDAAEPQVAGDWKPSATEYVIQAGDTLWDISERIVGSPWLWPRVWAYNPEIVNPHWIYPGDVVRFYPSQQELPRLVQLAASQRDLPQETAPEPPEPPPPPDDERKRPSIASVEAAPLPARSDAQSRPQAFVGLFVTERELAEAGVLTNAVADKMLLSPRDSVFVTFPDGTVARRGDRYMIFRTAREVHHPVTGKSWGYLTEITGFLSIDSFDDVARATITHASIEVERGQLVTPMTTPPMVELTIRPARERLEGYVLAVEGGFESMAGEQRMVFVDLGSKQGLELGNRLAVMIDSDPLGKEGRKKVPETRIGTLLVVDVKDTAATCLVLEAVREIVPGQKVRTVVLSGPLSSAPPPRR